VRFRDIQHFDRADFAVVAGDADQTFTGFARPADDIDAVHNFGCLGVEDFVGSMFGSEEFGLVT